MCCRPSGRIRHAPSEAGRLPPGSRRRPLDALQHVSMRRTAGVLIFARRSWGGVCRVCTVLLGRAHAPVTEIDSTAKDVAVRLGEIGVVVLRVWSDELAVEVRVGNELASRPLLDTTGPSNADGRAGKVATVTALGVSSCWRADATKLVAPTTRTAGRTLASRVGSRVSWSAASGQEPSRPPASPTSWTTSDSRRRGRAPWMHRAS
jgi:hypothetical protein